MSDYYLKILSGNHLGAEIPLEPGQYTLGKSDDCDLILTDDSLTETDFILEVSSDGTVSVKTEKQQPLFLNGAPSGQAISPEHFDVFTASGIHFAFGPANSPWPDIEIPELQKPEPKKTEDVDEDGDFPDPDAGDIISGKELEKDLIEDEYDEDIEDEDDELDIDPKWLIGVPAVFIVCMIAFGMLLFSDSDETATAASISPINQVSLIKNQLNLQDVKLRQLPDGTLLISGYTETLDKREALINQIREKQLPFRSQVIVMKDMRANAEALLKNRGYDSLKVEVDNTPGSLILTGYVISADQLDKVINLLKEEVYGLNDVVNQVDNQAGRIKTLKAMIKDKGLASRVHLIERPDKILVQGLLLDSGQLYKLQEVVTRFKSRYDNKPAIIIDAKGPGAGQKSSPLEVSNTPVAGGTGQKLALHPSVTVRGVSMGPIPYVIMADGGKYLLGSKLDNGYIIEDINLDYLLLSGSGSQKIKYQLGGKSGDKRAKR